MTEDQKQIAIDLWVAFRLGRHNTAWTERQAFIEIVGSYVQGRDEAMAMLFGLKDINGRELSRGDLVRDLNGNEATVEFGLYTHYLDHDDEHGSPAFGVYFADNLDELYFSEHITPDGTVAVEIVRNRSDSDESRYRTSTVEIPYTGLSPIKQISIKTSDCSGCPYSIPTVPEAFDIENDDMDEATGLMCRKSDRWIGGKNRRYDGPIPDWCELPDVEPR